MEQLKMSGLSQMASAFPCKINNPLYIATPSIYTGSMVSCSTVSKAKFYGDSDLVWKKASLWTLLGVLVIRFMKNREGARWAGSDWKGLPRSVADRSRTEKPAQTQDAWEWQGAIVADPSHSTGPFGHIHQALICLFVEIACLNGTKVDPDFKIPLRVE